MREVTGLDLPRPAVDLGVRQQRGAHDRFASRAEVADRLRRFREHAATITPLFEWRLTRYDSLALLARLEERELPLSLAA